VIAYRERGKRGYGGDGALVAHMLLDMQSGQALAMGYFGGYAGKEQKIGQRETERLSTAFSRKVEGQKGSKVSIADRFSQCSRRVLKDLESKGMIRTGVETTNLAEYADHPDTLMAECLRTFATVTFPAQLLLRREEVESGKTKGASVITPLHHAHGNRGRAYGEAPFDLMYGFRGRKAHVDLFSPFEMLRYWVLVKITQPNQANTSRSAWTAAARAFKASELDKGQKKPAYVAGVHYVAVDAEDRILLPERIDIEDLESGKKQEVLRGLRHVWCWEKRSRPYVPVWTKCKMPDRRWSPEENSRLLCLYMRPWSLCEADASVQNPLLSRLSRTHLDDAHCGSNSRPEPSYSSSWEWYVNGNVVSEVNRRYIVNMLGCTTARALDTADDDADDSDEDGEPDVPEHVGNLDLVQRTIDGMWAHSADDGILGFGRHSESIRLGRGLWQSDALPEEVRSGIREDVFEPSMYPSGKEFFFPKISTASHCCSAVYFNFSPFR
jgi:hypothetical protein